MTEIIETIEIIVAIAIIPFALYGATCWAAVGLSIAGAANKESSERAKQ